MSRIWKWLRGAAALVGCWWLIVTLTPLDWWWTQQLAKPWGSGQGDILVVLVGDSMTDGILGGSSYLRAVYTVRAMRACSFRKVIISGRGGGAGASAVSPAELIRNFVAAHGIDTTNVVVESESSSTEENALRLRPLLGEGGGKIVLLTSDYHVWRAYRVFRKAGIGVDPWPVPDVLKRSGAWPERSELFIELCRETAKIGWYRWKGWI
jgi:uncharacterized SAM-binding protein YcdF (DUF218 family)